MMLIVPCTAPFLVGENVALIVQLIPDATREPQVDFTANSALAFIEVMRSSVGPVLVRATVCGPLVVPMASCLKFRAVVGEKLTAPVLSNSIT